MKSYYAEKPLFSIHIPKTAGVSLQKPLTCWFGENLFLHYFDEKNSKMPEKHVLGPELCIHGHFNKKRGFGVFDYYPDADQFITFMRDPLELHLSNYFFVKKNCRRSINFRSGVLLDFRWKNVNDYLEKTRSFLLFYFPWNLTVNNYREIFEKNFVHIGTADNFQLSVNTLAAKLKKERFPTEVRNISPRDEVPSPEAMEGWKKRHELEYRIFEYARKSTGKKNG